MDRKLFIKSISLFSISALSMPLGKLQSSLDYFPKTERMPALFLGHGSPMNAIEENEFVQGFRELAKTLPKPNAILCISAHWYTLGTKVTVSKAPSTIHDFGGFPKELYNVRYPASGSPRLAKDLKKHLDPISVALDETWGLDHGAWSVIKHLYPKADVPVVQMSIDYSQSTLYHFDLAKRLQSYREKGILIIGSGNLIHNLGLIDFKNFEKVNYGYDWAIEAREYMNHKLLTGDNMALINYQNGIKSLHLAIPTPDHYLPMIYILGLKSKGETLKLFNDKLLAGSLSMTSFIIS